MTPQEIRDECARYREAGLENITFVMPPCWRPPHGFPRGEFLCVNYRNETVFRFPVANLELWLTAMLGAA